MKRRDPGRIHALEIPLSGLSLVVPSASIAEVVTLALVTPVPFGPSWLLGATGWRSLAVPVVSFEVLTGARAPAAAPGNKVVVFYPLRGRGDWEFFGILASGEPRPRAVDEGAVTADASELPNTSYVAAGLHVDDRLLAIPDLDTLKAALYPV